MVAEPSFPLPLPLPSHLHSINSASWYCICACISVIVSCLLTSTPNVFIYHEADLGWMLLEKCPLFKMSLPLNRLCIILTGILSEAPEWQGWMEGCHSSRHCHPSWESGWMSEWVGGWVSEEMGAWVMYTLPQEQSSNGSQDYDSRCNMETYRASFLSDKQLASHLILPVGTFEGLPAHG